jgi:hypothetical protein
MKLIKPALLVVATVMLAVPASAQRGPGQLYDPKSMVSVQGQVEKVETVSRQGRRGGAGKSGRELQLVYLKTLQGPVVVHLGPSRFLEQQQFTPKVGDAMSVTGSKVITGKGEVVLAAEVKSGSNTITLRDTQGIPLWSHKAKNCRPRFLGPNAPTPVPPQ